MKRFRKILEECFEGLEKEELDVLVANMEDVFEEVHYQAHDVIFREGDTDRELYLISEGEVRITKDIKQGGTKVLAILSDGGVFGEGALVSGKPRGASAESMTDVVAFKLKYEDFDNLLQEKPFSAGQLLMGIVKIVNQRLQYVNMELITLYEVSRILANSSGDMPEIANRVLEKFVEVTNCEEGTMFLHNLSTQNEDVVAVTGQTDAKFVSKVTDEVLDMVKFFEENTENRYKLDGKFLWLPIKNSQGRYLGMIALENTEGEFVRDEVKLALTVTDQLATSVERRNRMQDDQEKQRLDEEDVSL